MKKQNKLTAENWQNRIKDLYCKGEFCEWCKGQGTCGSGISEKAVKSFISQLLEALEGDIFKDDSALAVFSKKSGYYDKRQEIKQVFKKWR